MQSEQKTFDREEQTQDLLQSRCQQLMLVQSRLSISGTEWRPKRERPLGLQKVVGLGHDEREEVARCSGCVW